MCSVFTRVISLYENYAHEHAHCNNYLQQLSATITRNFLRQHSLKAYIFQRSIYNI